MNLPNKIIACDFETTGLNPGYDHPTSISCVVMENDVILDQFSRCIMPGDKCKLSLEALAVQGVSMKNAREAIQNELERIFPDDAITAKDCLIQLREWTKTNGYDKLPVVAQNAPFDWGFFSEKLLINRSAHNHDVFGPVWICTIALSGHALPDAKKRNLDALLDATGYPARSGKHDSLSDAMWCGKVYFGLKTILEKNN